LSLAYLLSELGVADRFGLHLFMKIEKGDTRLDIMESLGIHYHLM
jgi:hypothetical protein